MQDFSVANPHVWLTLVAFAVTILCTILSPKIPIPNAHNIYKRMPNKFFYIPLDMGTAPILALLFLLCTTTLNGSTLVKGLIGNDHIKPYSVLLLFMSLSYCCISLDLTGLFEYLAKKIVILANNSGHKLYWSFCIFASVLTVFTSNDIVILTLTPIICYMCVNSENMDPTPYVVSQFFVANIWSIALEIGNPTNIIVAEANKLNFLEYSKWLALPAVGAGLTCMGILYLVFFRSIPKVIIPKVKTGHEEEVHLASEQPIDDPVHHDEHDEHSLTADVERAPAKAQEQPELKQKWLAIGKTGLLFLCLLTLGISSLIVIGSFTIPAFAVTLIFFGVFFTIDIITDIVMLYNKYKRAKIGESSILLGIVKRMPWKIVPFVIGMFTMVAVMKEYGIIGLLAGAISNLIQLVGGISPQEDGSNLSFGGKSRAIFAAVFIMTYLSSFACNLLNNQPMTILFTDMLQDAAWQNKSFGKMYQGTQFGLIIGSNLGANITLIGALAGIMWIAILRQFNDERMNKISFFRFLFYGLIITPAVIFVPCVILSLELLVF